MINTRVFQKLHDELERKRPMNAEGFCMDCYAKENEAHGHNCKNVKITIIQNKLTELRMMIENV